MGFDNIIEAFNKYYDEYDKHPREVWVGNELYRHILRDAEQGELDIHESGVIFYGIALCRTDKIGPMEFTLREPKEKNHDRG